VNGVSHQDVFGADPWLTIGDRSFTSRLLLGVEQYTNPQIIGQVLRAASADVFITTYDLDNTRSSLLLSDVDGEIDLSRYTWIGTTSFARSPEAAVETAVQLRDKLDLDIIKLDVRSSDNLPDAEGTILAAKQLIGGGFTILPLVLPDVTTVLALQELGCVAVRLMGSPVGAHRGLADPTAVKDCIDALTIPSVVEGGIGSPAHVVQAMELGADAVLVNTMIAKAEQPAVMAQAVYQGLLAGGLAARARNGGTH